MAKTTTLRNLAEELGKRDAFASLRQETYLNLVRTHEQLYREFSQFFKSYGLSDAQYNALRILRGEDQPMHVHQIAARMIFANTDISRLIERMHASGLVNRERCGEDRRVVWISLTEKSRRILLEIDQPLQQLHDEQFTNLNDRELSTLNELLFRSRQRAD